jgi:Flp pilus assembly protein TadG
MKPTWRNKPIWRHGPERGARDRGTISLFTVLFAVSVILLAGLLVDGGLAIHARQRAADIAEQAARAGADDIDVEHLRATGEAKVNADTACGRAVDLLEAYPETADHVCVPSADEVRMTVQINVRPQLLSIVPGFGTFTIDASASAHPDVGNP